MEELDKSFFACETDRKYPLHTKQAALNSYGQYCSEKSQYAPAIQQEIEAKFTKAASFHGIELEGQVKEAACKTPEVVKFDGKKINITMKKIACSEDIEQAADYLIEKRASTSLEDLVEPARYVLSMASVSDLDLSSPKIRKIACMAGIGVGDRETVVEELSKRAMHEALPRVQQAKAWAFVHDLEKLTDEEFYEPENMRKVCSVMDSIDEMHGNRRQYGAGMMAPEEAVYGQNHDDLLKEASDLAFMPSLELTFSKKALLERSEAVNSFFKDYFGQEKALEGDELIEKVASLDAHTADALLGIIE